MIPEEDRPASWLGDYGGIEADIRQMREFADRLRAEVERHYAPHLSYITDDMKAAIPNPCDAFIELVQFLQAHHQTQQATADAVYAVRDQTGHMAGAASTIATKYSQADAFSAARVTDVEYALARPDAVASTGAHSVVLDNPTDDVPQRGGPAVRS
ncbi:hypothetical protein ACFY3U_17300 [Micromonospora sp. NPDC000089]|uniref:hypothetical protein n=1 Tax=unclassified Micromonospora TaxID=2617518 RepID=UPI003685E328